MSSRKLKVHEKETSSGDAGGSQQKFRTISAAKSANEARAIANANKNVIELAPPAATISAANASVDADRIEALFLKG
jgi:hypothetical protein